MKGPQQGNLTFGIKPYNQPIIRLYTLSGDQGDKWMQANVEVGYNASITLNTTFQFVFEAVVGGALSKFALV